MTDRKFQDWLLDILENNEKVDSISTFNESGMLTIDKGLLVTLENGTTFALTIKEY